MNQTYRRSFSRHPTLAVLAILLLAGAPAQAQSTARSENFSSDPHWDGLRNRSIPNPVPIVTQNFGYKSSSVAGGAAGELGGHIERTLRPAWYADDIQTKTFNDVLTASGKLSMPAQNTGAGLHFGWFNSLRQGWRPWSATMGFRLDGRGNEYSNILLDYMTQTWKAGGVNLGSSNPSFRIPHNNSDHTWQMQYDPSGNGGGGTLSFALDGGAPALLNLDPGRKAQGANFNRFGLWNQQASGGGMDAYFDDVTYDGNFQNFSNSNTGWEANGNNVTFADPEQRGAHNYGWSNTNRVGGAAAGEMGGLIFRPEVHKETYYGARTDQNLTLNNTLFASGKVSLVRAASDGGAYIGWFNKQSIENTVETQPQVAPVANFLGVNVEGPSSVGHYFRPVFATSDAERRDSQDGPIIFPDATPHDFTILYEPAANNGLGKITVTLDALVKEFNLTAADRAEGALFDHFGIFGISPDGHYVDFYFDDLTYTVGTGPATAQWGVDASGDWKTSANWTARVAPNMAGATATFGNVISADRLVYADSSVTLGKLTFDSPRTYLLAGLGSLTMQVSSGSALIEVLQGTHKINLPLVIASNTNLNVAGGSTLLISDPVTVAAGKTLTQTGAGAVSYQSTITLQSGASINLQQGSMLARESQYGAIEALIRLGLNGGDWLGTGITSSAAAHDPQHATAVGVVNDGGEVLVKYTIYGDANLDSIVDIADFNQFRSGYDDGGDAAWLTGDFDYSGSVDPRDFDLMVRGLAFQDRGVSGDFFVALSEFVRAEGLNVDLSAVPEPSVLGLIILAASASLLRARKRDPAVH